MSKPELTPKQEQFARHIAVGCSQADAYRKSYKPKRASQKTVHEAASRVMKLSKVAARVKELSRPIEQKVRKTRQDLEDLIESWTYRDAGQCYDAHGNPIEIPQLPEAQRLGIAGFTFTEDFIGVRKGKDQHESGEERMATGYTKKVLFVDPLKAAQFLAKLKGWTDSDEEIDDPEKLKKRSLTVNFVSVNGKHIQINQSQQRRLVSPAAPSNSPDTSHVPASARQQAHSLRARLNPVKGSHG